MADAEKAKPQGRNEPLVTETTEITHDLATALDGTYSSLREKMLEHAFLTELARALWRSGRRDFEFLRAEVDRGGYDVAVECGGVLRHIQLKSRHREGKATEVSLALALADKPSGCAVWIDYDPLTLEIGPFLWFGGAPGEKLPALGDKVTRHSKGAKQERPAHRTVRRSGFSRIATMDALAVTLFGPAPRKRARSNRLASLAELAPALRNAAGFDGEGGEDTGARLVLGTANTYEPGVIDDMPHYDLGGLLGRFVDLAVSDWTVDAEVLDSAETTTESLRASPELIGTASEADLAVLTTALVREERFTEGAIVAAARDGIVLRICERAEALQNGVGNEPRK